MVAHTLRCLYLAHRAPYPPKGGAKVRAFHSIKHLHDQGHEVVVATLTRDAEEAHDLRGLSEYCSEVMSEPVGKWPQTLRMVRNLARRVPSTMGYFESPALMQRVADAHANSPFDIVVCHSSSVAPYAEQLANVPKLMDFVDMDSQKWLLYAKVHSWPLSWGYHIEGSKLEREEARIADAFDASIVVSAGEHDILSKMAPSAMTDWVPNGVDVHDFSPSTLAYDENTISFIGRFDYYPNEQGATWFCKEVLPRLGERLPDIRLQLVGAEPSKAVRALATHNVEVTGTVPAVQPYVHNSLATVAPLLIARGIQNKILESMAMGVPAIVSRESAKGVDAEPDVHLIACTTPDEYVEAIVALATDPALRERLAAAGRERAADYLTWPRVMGRLDRLTAKLLA